MWKTLLPFAALAVHVAYTVVTVHCPLNEVYDECMSPCPPRFCNVSNALFKCKAPLQKGDPNCPAPTCRCADGYYRTEDGGDCVTKKQCNSCGKNQVLDLCPSSCPPGTCATRDKVYSCPAQFIPGDSRCAKPKCRCKNNYFTNTEGNCVSREQCAEEETNCPENEEYKICPSECPPRFCNSTDIQFNCVTPLEPGDPNCPKPKCQCKNGFYRNDAGRCVTKNECHGCTKTNEEWNPCAPQTSGTCDYLNSKKKPCQATATSTSTSKATSSAPASTTYKCKGECRCKKGFYYNYLKECISEENCRRCNGTNEYYSCGGACDNVCSNLSKQNQSSCPIVNVKCNEMCYCKKGHARNANNICVPFAQCEPEEGICGVNEVRDPCPSGCPPRTCETRNRIYECPAEYPPGDPRCPKPKCRCKDNYYRNSEGKCVSKEQCSKDETKCPHNEEYKICPSECPPRFCNSTDIQFSCVTPLEPGDKNCPKPKCQCKNGFYRNNEGRCVTKNECHGCTKTNEEWTPCAPRGNGTCDYFNANGNQSTNLQKTSRCKGECRCKKGFYYNYLKDCVTEGNCRRCNGPNEYYSCGGACDNVCSNLSKQNQSSCPIVNIKCNEMCYCKEGHARNANNICVPFAQCEPEEGRCNGPNEFYSCGGACDNVCSNLSKQNQSSCPIVNVKCNEMCYCKEGHARNANNICVPFDQCEPESDNDGTGDDDSNNGNSTECSSTDVSTGEEKFYQGNDQFTVDFSAEVSKDLAGTSTIMSPYSLLFLLLQLALYANGNAFDQLTATGVINVPDKHQIRCMVPSLIDSVTSQSDVTLDLATKVYANINNALSNSFLTDTSVVFRATAENLDFSKPVEAAETINTWVEEHTNNKIQDIISPDSLSTDTRVVLVNAIYFKGKWEQPFNVNRTTDRPFYRANGDNSTVRTMYQEGKFLYGTSGDLDCQILSMPYTGGQLSFVIYLPNQVDGLPALQEKMRNISITNNALNNLRNTSIHTYVPLMNITTTIDLVPLLQKLGVSQIFDTVNSGLSGILAVPEDVFVSAAVQKAFIEVNEEGTEAGAANVITITTTSVQLDPLTFDANRGFAYQIRLSGNVIFTGTYSGN